MQTVAAQWVMISLTSSALLLSAISAAGSIPVLLLAVPAGALGDLLDRRRLILGAQALMLLAAVALAVLASVGAITPGVLLALLVVIGIGGAASAPTWQTLQPELVPPADRPQAIALGSVNQNLARAVGPALGGLLLAATSASLVFLANAVSFLAVLGAVAVAVIPAQKTHRPARARDRGGPGWWSLSSSTVRLCSRSWRVRSRSSFRRGRSGRCCLWSRATGSASDRRDTACSSGASGLALWPLPPSGRRVRRRFTPRALYALACVVVAAASLLLAVGHSVELAVVALVAAGGAWITGLGLLGAAYQGELPRWVKARGLSYYLIAFQGANGIGSLVLGGVAQASSVSTALLIVGAMLAIAVVATWRLGLPAAAPTSGLFEEPLPLPDVQAPVAAGPVSITVDYPLAPGKDRAFVDAAASLRRARRRTGAIALAPASRSGRYRPLPRDLRRRLVGGARTPARAPRSPRSRGPRRHRCPAAARRSTDRPSRGRRAATAASPTASGQLRMTPRGSTAGPSALLAGPPARR